MKYYINNRVILEGIYFLKNNKTVRQTAERFKVSKSTIHKDLTERLPKLDNKLFLKVADLLSSHLLTRHIKGGESTRLKYAKIK